VSISTCGVLLSIAAFSPFKAVPVIGMAALWAAGLVGCVIDSRQSACRTDAHASHR
jgi:hypothetical protein